MFELIGIIFGGASRLVQHWLELRDKDKERAHEAVMYDKQIQLADKRFEHDAALRRMDGEQAEAGAEWEAMRAAVEAQAREAAAAGGWVAKFSAAMRPMLTFYHAILLFTANKAALFYIAYAGSLQWATAFTTIYGDFDRALVGSIVGFWFQDRALRRRA